MRVLSIETKVDSNGNYQFKNLPSGNYSIVAYDTEYQYSISNILQIEVAARGETAVAPLSLSRSGGVSILVCDRWRQPLCGTLYLMIRDERTGGEALRGGIAWKLHYNSGNGVHLSGFPKARSLEYLFVPDSGHYYIHKIVNSSALDEAGAFVMIQLRAEDYSMESGRWRRLYEPCIQNPREPWFLRVAPTNWPMPDQWIRGDDAVDDRIRGNPRIFSARAGSSMAPPPEPLFTIPAIVTIDGKVINSFAASQKLPLRSKSELYTGSTATPGRMQLLFGEGPAEFITIEPYGKRDRVFQFPADRLPWETPWREAHVDLYTVSISGEIRNSAGAPVDAAIHTLQQKRDGKFTILPPSSGNPAAITKNGEFRIQQIPEGDYLIIAIPEDPEFAASCTGVFHFEGLQPEPRAKLEAPKGYHFKFAPVDAEGNIILGTLHLEFAAGSCAPIPTRGEYPMWVRGIEIQSVPGGTVRYSYQPANPKFEKVSGEWRIPEDTRDGVNWILPPRVGNFDNDSPRATAAKDASAIPLIHRRYRKILP